MLFFFLSDFEDLAKAYVKTKKVIEQTGIPRFYIKCLVELEDFISDMWEDRDGRKAMSKTNSKGLTTLRQKLRKYMRDFEDDIKGYRENPDAEEEELQAESEDEEDVEVVPSLKPKIADGFLKPIDKAAADDDDDDDDSLWGSDHESSSSSDDELPSVGGLRQYTAAMFLKKTGEEASKEAEAKRIRKEEKAQKKKDSKKDEGEWTDVVKGAPHVIEKTVMFAKDTEVNHEAVMKKLTEIISARGKKSTDRNEQIELLHELATIADTNNLGPAVQVKIMFNIVAAIYDYNPNIATCMRSEMWDKCIKNVGDLLELIANNADITVGENILEDSENVETSPYRVRGCILTVVERMDEEFTKMLQACDAHSTEYVDRLKDETVVCEMIEKLQAYLEGKATTEEMCRVYLKRVEHTYYKFDHTIVDGTATEDPTREVMQQLCKYIHAKDNSDRLRTRAMLCHIYHHALHNRWYQARDLMLMSHLQDTIQHSDIPTQILYNRTMVQLGLCAFREGMIRDSHNALVDIQSGGRAKELLAQGLLLQRQHERTPEQEKIEKRRLLPYHMHINLELLECVYLVSAMLMEIPYMAAHEFDARRRMISKNFHHVLRLSERQTLPGPPESMREHVVAASKAMKKGNWNECQNFIINDKMNAKVWDLFYQKDRVRDMVTRKIQEESLRTYLFTYSSVYDSLSLVSLAEMFELEISVVHSIISKMIINEELMASLDEPTRTVVMHRTEPTRLQSLALQLSEKVSSLVDNNEKIMEFKQGNFGFQKTNQNYGGYQQNKDNWQGNKYQNKDNWTGGSKYQNKDTWQGNKYQQNKDNWTGGNRRNQNRQQRAY
ncbi:translation initiation factor 3 subunit C [Mytilus galloprovincialis]|uniref:Eukaryotic translation initiation factor 3 subunit C n=1 Tax=Mytilus galloprovincialis TaxID=29158 RepID=A0A8B6D145_MYTGA|nr:translation initiation factor 3 subunit C [Mytilus galloprovincialis]